MADIQKVEHLTVELQNSVDTQGSKFLAIQKQKMGSPGLSSSSGDHVEEFNLDDRLKTLETFQGISEISLPAGSKLNRAKEAQVLVENDIHQRKNTVEGEGEEGFTTSVDAAKTKVDTAKTKVDAAKLEYNSALDNLKTLVNNISTASNAPKTDISTTNQYKSYIAKKDAYYISLQEYTDALSAYLGEYEKSQQTFYDLSSTDNSKITEMVNAYNTAKTELQNRTANTDQQEIEALREKKDQNKMISQTTLYYYAIVGVLCLLLLVGILYMQGVFSGSSSSSSSSLPSLTSSSPLSSLQT